MSSEKKKGALVVRTAAELNGNYRGDALRDALDQASERFNLVSPATSCASLPEGCEVGLAAVAVDTSKQAKEVYDIAGGQLGLSKVVLDRIAAAAGISWDPHLSRRLDDGSHPHYCRFHVVGRYRHFDGQLQTIQATKEMDLRDGSAQVDGMWERYRASKAKWDSGNRGRMKYPPKEPTDQIREQRIHIEAHAETKARMRAIRSLGIKTSYTEEELRKPFVVARMMFTGRSDDPQLEREFSLMRGQAMLGATSALYGSTPQNGHDGPRPLPPQALPQRHAPPPLKASRPDDSDPGHPEPISAPGESAPPSEPSSARGSDGPVISFGKNKGTPISALSDRDLKWYLEKAERDVEDPDRARFRRENEELLGWLRSEKAERDERGDDPDRY